MAWTEGDLRIFAAGLAIGGRWNRTFGTLPRVKSSVASGTYWYAQYFTLSCDLTEATILYSIDGGTPTTVYAGEEIYIDDDMVCLAYAVYGQGLSPMSKFTYIVDNPFQQLDTLSFSHWLFTASDDDDIVIDTVVFEESETVAISSTVFTISDSESINV
jgi:hypothetical protein